MSKSNIWLQQYEYLDHLLYPIPAKGFAIKSHWVNNKLQSCSSPLLLFSPRRNLCSVAVLSSLWPRSLRFSGHGLMRRFTPLSITCNWSVTWVSAIQRAGVKIKYQGPPFVGYVAKTFQAYNWLNPKCICVNALRASQYVVNRVTDLDALHLVI